LCRVFAKIRPAAATNLRTRGSSNPNRPQGLGKKKSELSSQPRILLRQKASSDFEVIAKSGCPTAATPRTSETEEIGYPSRSLLRTKTFSIGLVMGISAARSGTRYGLYHQDANECLIPIIPFPRVPSKPTLRDLAQRMAAPKTPGERIRFLRLSRGLRQDELAKMLRVCNSAVCQWEKGLTEPRPEHFNRLAASLGVPVSQLTGKIPLQAKIFQAEKSGRHSADPSPANSERLPRGADPLSAPPSVLA
jgi:transcriptional regulator with XRE-family HTH domain